METDRPAGPWPDGAPDTGEPAPVFIPAGGADVAIDSLAVGYVAVSHTWQVRQVNPAAEAILGRRAGELVGRDLWDELPGARELEFGQVYEHVMTTRTPAAFDAYYPGLDVWFELRIQPVPDGIACYFLDITARKLADERAATAAAAAAERSEFIRTVADGLSSNLDVVSNVNQLARLVVPYLGSWSIVSIADEFGALVDTAWWHGDPLQREKVARYAEVRQSVMVGTIAGEALSQRRPTVLLRDAHRLIRARLEGAALERFDELAPVASAVLPMIARGRTVGMLTLYADTELTEAQFDVARDVASRAAMALDNSLAYERAGAARADAEAARAEAEAVTQRFALLARVSESLAGSDDPDVAVGNLARLLVPHLADWSLVTLLDEDGERRDVGVAHRDPDRESDVAAYAEVRRSTSQPEDSPLNIALRTGEPYLIAAMPDELLGRVQPDAEAVGLARRLHAYGLAVIPLTARGRVFGALSLVTTHERGSHTPEELAVALEVARRAGPVLDSARAAHRARRLAESMQRSVLSVPPAPPGFDIVTRYRPAQADHEVGGDWYDHFDLPDGSTFVAIGDVMGHDTAAIAAMAQLRTLMRAAAWTGSHSPAMVLTDTDSASRALGPGTLATSVTAVLEPRPDGTVGLQWSSAGHPPALVVEPDGTARFLGIDDDVDVPLGVRSVAPRRDHETSLEAGSLLVLYTDGLIERRGRILDDGLRQLRELVVSLRHLTLDGLVEEVLVQMTPAGARHDDVALLALRVAPLAVPRGTHDRLLLRLPADTSAPAIARERLRDYIRELPTHLGQDATLIISELVTNALRHGLPPITLDIRRVPGGVRVAVNDQSPHYPVLPDRHPSASSSSGRGLLLTDALTTSWGIDSAPVGKTVWFTIVV